MNTRFQDYIDEYSAVRRRDKPLMICEKCKSPSAYSAIRPATSLAGHPDSYALLPADARGPRRDASAVAFPRNGV